jgi:sugar phosphate isomerase/epimerase
MRFVYFTKLLKGVDVKGLIGFCKEVGLDGVDLAVRPGYPIHPGNVTTALHDAAKAFVDAGLVIGFVTANTDLSDAGTKAARDLFEACGKAGISAIKIGYFPYRAPFADTLKAARARMSGFEKLAGRTKVKACYHTHSGGHLGNNGAGLRLLLQDLDPHHIGAFLDTGHLAVNGGPIRMEMDMVRLWFALLAIKDMAWTKGKAGWSVNVVPAGGGIVHWADVGRGIKELKFNGVVSLHGEYETKDQADRIEKAKKELAFVKKHFE